MLKAHGPGRSSDRCGGAELGQVASATPGVRLTYLWDARRALVTDPESATMAA